MAEAPKPINVTVPCHACPAQTKLEGVVLETLDLNQRWEEIAPLLGRLGWGVRENETGNLTGFCPACLANKDKLPAFTGVDAGCPKCGEGGVKTIFCRGHAPQCGYRGTREHLHRECGCCGYDWIEACKDDAAGPRPVVDAGKGLDEASEASYGADRNVCGVGSTASG